MSWKADVKIKELEQRVKAMEKTFQEGFEIVVTEVKKEKDDERS